MKNLKNLHCVHAYRDHKHAHAYTHMIFPLILFTGPIDPKAPELGEITPSPHSVVIRWTVSSVTYTPETYTVHYGIDSAILNLTSDTLATDVKTDFLNIKDQDYRLVIDGLQPAQKYHYFVLSTNSYASSKTDKHSFTTADSGKKIRRCSSFLIMPFYSTSQCEGANLIHLLIICTL